MPNLIHYHLSRKNPGTLRATVTREKIRGRCELASPTPSPATHGSTVPVFGRPLLPLLAACLLLAPACSKKEEAEKEAPAPVQVTAVTQDTIRRIVDGDGTLFPLAQQNVMPKITSPVQRFFFNRGDHVKEGQLLATLEHKDLTAQAAEAKGGVDQAESNFRSTQGASIPESVVKAQTDVDAAKQGAEAAKRLYDSQQELFKEGALPRRRVDEAMVAYAQANGTLLSAQEHLRALQAVSKDEQIKTATAQVAAAQSHFQSLDAQVAYAEVHSPITGVVADRPLYPGDMASTGVPLFMIMDISSVVARVNVPQVQANLVRVGQPVEVALTGTDETVPGKVFVVSPATDPASTTLQVWIDIPNPGERLKPGASVHAKIISQSFKAAAVVPTAAILPGEEGGTMCLVIDDKSVAHQRLVQVGVTEGNKVQITNGVRPGEEVVIVGGLGVDDKAKVKVIDATAKEPDEDETDNEPPAGQDQKK